LNLKLIGKLSLSVALALLAGSVSTASAFSGDIGVGATSLGNIIIDGKGMTAYYYDRDLPNSGVSTCTGACLTHWPIIAAATSTPVVQGISAKVTIIAATNQIVINGRPIYTFAGDIKPGDTNGQGVGGVWYVVSPSGVELTPAELAKATAAPSASPTPTATPSPSKSSTGPIVPKKIIPKKKVAKKKAAKPTAAKVSGARPSGKGNY
jgi:predicted lipoprotein with Yx(FWY)xxD motif